MYKMQRILLALLACFYSATLFAQVSVTVKISGIDKQLEDNVRLFLSIEQQKEHPLMSEGRLQRLHKKAPQEISKALQPFGYYRPDIKTEISQPTPNHWLATYSIELGPPLPIGQLNLVISEEMRDDPEFKALIKDLPLHKGDVFNHLEYENAKADLTKLAVERGYFDDRFVEHRVDIDLDVYEARIYLNYDGGRRYHFGDVRFDQDVLNPEFLQRYITFDKGTPYELSELIDLQQALNDSRYFNLVEISPDETEPGSFEVPITISLTPRKPNRYSFGLGYGTDTGARAKFGWEKPRLNRKGHRFNTNASVSQIGHSFTVFYRVPVFNPRTDQLIYSAGVVDEDTDNTDSTVHSVGVSLNRNRGEWRESLSIDYQRENYVISDDHEISYLLMPGVNWSRTWGDDFIYTFDGLRFDIALRGANQKVLSDNNFFQLQGGIKAINPLGKHNRIISRGNLGAIWTEDFSQVPTSLRFYTGGSQSVRGYAYQSLGPKDDNNDDIGGKYLMVGSIEFEHSFDNKWSVAFFYDAGNAMDDIKEDLERGAGFGVRWKSPVGAVRFDFASAVSRDNKPWRFHLNIGPDL